MVLYVDPKILRWFEHVERMNEYRMSRSVLMTYVNGLQAWGRPILGSIDSVKVALLSKGMTEEAQRYCSKDRKQWRTKEDI